MQVKFWTVSVPVPSIYHIYIYLFQPGQALEYEVMGNALAAQYFAVNPNGQVFVKNDLRLDAQKNQLYNVSDRGNLFW